MASLKIALIKRITGAAESSFSRSSFAGISSESEKIDGLIDILRNLLRLTGILMEHRFQPGFKISLDKLVMVWHWPT